MITVEVIANCSGTVTAAWAGSAPVVTGNTLALGTNAINSEDITFTYTAAEDGTLALTLKYPTYGKPTDVLQASYSVNGGEAVAFTYGQGFVTMKKGDVVTVEVVANCIASIEAVWTKATVEVTTTPLELGTNEVEGENITFEYEATEDGKLTLTAKPQATDNADASFSVTVSVNGGEATTLKNDAATEFTLKTGDVVVVTVTTNQSGSIEVTWTATPEEDDEPSSDIR